jgi:hypothetical protein
MLIIKINNVIKHLAKNEKRLNEVIGVGPSSNDWCPSKTLGHRHVMTGRPV